MESWPHVICDNSMDDWADFGGQSVTLEENKQD